MKAKKSPDKKMTKAAAMKAAAEEVNARVAKKAARKPNAPKAKKREEVVAMASTEVVASVAAVANPQTALAKKEPTGLFHYDAACREIELAKTMDEAKGFSSKAEAIAVYARLMGDRKLEIDALDVRGRAEKKWAELHETMKAKGTRSQLVGLGVIGGSGNEPPIDTPTLEELGVDKKESAEAHKLAALPKEEFEQKVAVWREIEEKGDGHVGRHILNAGKKKQGRQQRERAPAPFDEESQLGQLAHAFRKAVENLWPKERDLTPVIGQLRRYADYLESVQLKGVPNGQ